MDPSDTVPLTLSIVGLVLSTILQLSPVPAMRRIINRNYVAPYRPDPFILAINYEILNGAYAVYTRQITGAVSNYFGLALCIG